MSAENQGAQLGDKLDNASRKSYHEYGAKVGSKLDGARNYVNENFKDSKGTTPEDHVKTLYSSTLDLAAHTYDYAWSWVPYTKEKAQKAKAVAENESINDLKHDLKTKGYEVKESAKHKEDQAQATLYSLIDEVRALAGQFIGIGIHYVEVAEKKTDEAASDAKAKTDKKTASYIDQARGLAAKLLKTSQDLVTYGQQKASQAAQAAKETAGDAKQSAENVKDGAQAELNGNGGAPHFELNVRV